MKHQARIKDTMSDRPVSGLYATYAAAREKLENVREEIRTTWATPDGNAAYIFENRREV